MSIPAVKPGGWGPGMVPRASELAQLDEKVATRGLDTQEDDSITGEISITAGVGVNPEIVANGDVELNVPGAKFSTANGGRLVTGDADFVTFTATRTRTTWISMLEAFTPKPRLVSGAYNGAAYRIDPASGGIRSAVLTTGFGTSAIEIPITKPHDGATLDSLEVFFYLPTIPTAIPSGGMTNLSLFKWPISGTSKIGIGGATMATPSNVVDWYAGGAVQSFSTSGLGEVFDMSANRYQLVLFDVGTTSAGDLSQFPVYLGIKLGWIAIHDERFSQ